MAYDTNIQGYKSAGGWRYPYTQQSSTATFYQPRAYDEQKLKDLANRLQAPQGLLDQAVNPAQASQQGLLSNSMDGGDRGERSLYDDTDRSTLNASNAAPGTSGAMAGRGIGAALSSMLGLGPAPGAKLGNWLGSQLPSQLEYNAYGTLGDGGLGVVGDPVTGPGTIGVRDAWGSNESPYGAQTAASMQSMADALAADTAALNEMGGGGGGFGGDTSGANGGDNTGGGGARGGDRGDSGFAKGGHVTMGLLGGPDPKGKDDGYAALDAGEYVIKSDMVKKHGLKALKALNEGRASITMKG